MKINIKFLQKKKDKTNLIKKLEEVNTKKYWNGLLVLFVFVLIIGAVFGFLTFRKSNRELTVDLTNLPQGNFFDKKDEINELLKYFETKELKRINIINNYQVIDPSL